MGDKVEAILEKMVDELMWYQDEEIFGKKEVRKIVKERRDAEYRVQRKDATITFFLDAINYEKGLERAKNRRKKKLEKVNADFRHENGIKRRIMHLYDRACRKFKQNKAIWREYLEFLVKVKAF